MKANKWIAIDKAQDDWETEACKRLWVAVFRQAFLDAHERHELYQPDPGPNIGEAREAKHFLQSEYAHNILFLLGINTPKKYLPYWQAELGILRNDCKKHHSEGALEIRGKERAAQKIIRERQKKIISKRFWARLARSRIRQDKEALKRLPPIIYGPPLPTWIEGLGYVIL